MPAGRTLRTLIVAALTGALTVGASWAGIGLAPVTEILDPELGAAEKAEGATGAAALPRGRGQFTVGAAKVSIEPRPAAYGGTWQKEGCATAQEDAGAATFGHLGDLRLPWPEDPSCLYSGGYGIGPMNPITSWDTKYGLWVRALYISDGKDALVLVILDGTSYFGRFGGKLCSDCGAFDLARELGAKYRFDPAGFMLASTHSHTAPDFIGGWGGVPGWYMEQVADAVRAAVGRAYAQRRPASVEAGEELAREFSAERRDFYRSAEDPTMSWVRFYRAGTRRTIATLAAFGAHPVTADESEGVAHADFPGVFEKRVEQRFGGVGLFFQTGLGNMSPRGETEELGNGLAAVIPGKGQGQPVTGTDVKVGQVFWDQPITNIPLGTLGAAGFFDRAFSAGSVVDEGENDVRRCRSASPLGVETAVSGAKVGDLWFTGAPGETFSNLTNTIEEKAPSIAFPLAQVNDGLGYIIQSFETDHVGRQGTGFVGDPVAEYEDAFGLDACFGDAVLEKTLNLMGSL
jgi:hypothetical protein